MSVDTMTITNSKEVIVFDWSKVLNDEIRILVRFWWLIWYVATPWFESVLSDNILNSIIMYWLSLTVRVVVFLAYCRSTSKNSIMLLWLSLRTLTVTWWDLLVLPNRLYWLVGVKRKADLHLLLINHWVNITKISLTIAVSSDGDLIIRDFEGLFLRIK
jgi:hypothetical protein